MCYCIQWKYKKIIVKQKIKIMKKHLILIGSALVLSIVILSAVLVVKSNSLRTQTAITQKEKSA
jgi:hypothetical protein